jgi:hypothetical protein
MDRKCEDLWKEHKRRIFRRAYLKKVPSTKNPGWTDIHIVKDILFFNDREIEDPDEKAFIQKCWEKNPSKFTAEGDSVEVM